jgi:branched-chain amino acid transport system ATP-binding protein
MSLLETRNLTKRFDGFEAVRGVELSVDRGEIGSIIGPNGAGKTTLFNLLTGSYRVSEGSIYFEGDEITDTAAHERPYLGIARSYQITNVYPDMTVSENVETAVAVFHTNYYDMLRPLSGKSDVTERTADILSTLGLEDKRNIEASTLSHGNKRRLEIGMALAAEPELLLLDEPTAGMDTAETERTMALVEEIGADKGVLLVEHDIEIVMEVSDHITVLKQGDVIASGTPEEIQTNRQVQEAYLGETHA